MHDGKPFFSQSLCVYVLFKKNVNGPLESIDFANAVILVFAFVGKDSVFFLSKLAGMLDSYISQCFFVKTDVKSFPFEELMIDLASWTP